MLITQINLERRQDSSRILYHGSPLCIVDKPRVIIGKYTKDFGYGFYCTEIEEQAKRWSLRKGGPGYVSTYVFSGDSNCNSLIFPRMNDMWLDFIVDCRRGISHDFDYVEGPMADDTIHSYIDDFKEGRISRAAFWELAKFKHPTHQICFCTTRATAQLRFQKGETYVCE